jgi:hypothetical protein
MVIAPDRCHIVVIEHWGKRVLSRHTIGEPPLDVVVRSFKPEQVEAVLSVLIINCVGVGVTG